MSEEPLIPKQYRFAEREALLRASAAANLVLLPLARAMVEFMAQLLHELPDIAVSDPPAGLECRRVATFQLAAIAMRSACGVITLVEAGYESESHGLKRRTGECVDRATAITRDPSGETARQWLDGKGRTPRSMAERHGLIAAWEAYSRDAHATSFTVAHLWNPPAHIPVDPSDRSLLLTPSRNAFHANALLFDCAFELGSLAGALAETYEITVAIPGAIGDALRDGRAWLEAHRPDRPVA